MRVRLAAVLLLVPPFFLPSLGQNRTIEGIVFDSLANKPLADAGIRFVQVSPTAGLVFPATSGANGSYTVALPHGQYVVGFDHVRLDSLGIEIPTVDARVDGQSRKLDLAIPSSRTIARMLCQTTDSSATGVLLGHVRAARARAARDSVAITIAWMELSSQSRNLTSEERHISTRFAHDGWYGICNVPHSTPVFVKAEDSSSTTGTIAIQIEPYEIRHLPLYVGTADKIIADSASASLGMDDVWGGEETLGGTVRDATGSGLAGVTVTVSQTGHEATTDSRGEFVLRGLPSGTWMLSARKPGFEPVNQVLNLGTETNVSVQMTPSAPQLAAVEVTGRMTNARMAAFTSRMSDAEKGILRGHFITREQIDRRGATSVTNLLEGLSGVRVNKHPNSGDFRKRVVYGTNGCRMTVYLDEIRILPKLDGATPQELNEIIPSSSDLAGVEVYPSMAGAPPKYQALNGTCGVILLWTR